MKTFFLTAKHICWKFGLLSLLLPLFRQEHIEHRPWHVFHSYMWEQLLPLCSILQLFQLSLIFQAVSPALILRLTPSFLPTPTACPYPFKPESQLHVMCAKSLQCCPTLCDTMECSLEGYSVHEILQARILEWVAMSSSRGSSWPRNWTRVCCISWIGREVLYH